MLITFANQKGGVGKSTLVMLFANWLTERDEAVVILDADRQNSVQRQRERDSDAFAEQEFKYYIQDFSIDRPQRDIYNTIQRLKAENPEAYILLDAPGNLSESGIVPCLALADVIVCPFQYEIKVLDSTGTFIVVLKRLVDAYKTSPKRVFVPNRVRLGTGTRKDKEIFQRITEVFQQYGEVSPYVKDLKVLSEVNTMSLSKVQSDEVKNCFETLIEICKK